MFVTYICADGDGNLSVTITTIENTYTNMNIYTSELIERKTKPVSPAQPATATTTTNISYLYWTKHLYLWENHLSKTYNNPPIVAVVSCRCCRCCHRNCYHITWVTLEAREILWESGWEISIIKLKFAVHNHFMYVLYVAGIKCFICAAFCDCDDVVWPTCSRKQKYTIRRMRYDACLFGLAWNWHLPDGFMFHELWEYVWVFFLVTV